MRFTPGSRIATAWFSRSISARIVTLTLGLLLAVQLASFGAIRASLGQHARSTLPERLVVGERVLQSLLDQNAQKLSEGARLLAADDGFRSAVQSNDAGTIASVLGNHGARIGTTEAALLATDFTWRAASGDNSAALAPIVARLARQAMAASVGPGGQAGGSEIALLGGKPHQLVLVPMQAPVLVGWVLMGFPLDTKLASAMKNLSALDVTLLARAAGDAPWAVALSSLPADQALGFAQADGLKGGGSAAGAALPMASVSVSVAHAQSREEFGVRTKWLTSPLAAAGEAPMATPQPGVLALVSVSIDGAVHTPRDLQIALAAITLLGFVVFGFGSLFTARRVTTPLRELAAAADRLGAGDYHTPMGGLRRADEIGQLAHSFEKMRVSVGEKQTQILKLAYWDSLTGLPNRMQFRDAVRDAIAQAQASPDDAQPGATVAVIMLDLDRFKHVNDVLGYRIGDLLLGRVGERLSEQVVRGGDLVARLGGDEFAVLLREGNAALAESVAKRIATAFDVPLTLEEHTIDMGAGIGMACWPQHATDADALLSRAEVAMYAAKQRAQGPLMYHASIDAASAQTLSLLTELRQAVDRNELRLYLQPKLMLDTGRVSGAEALVRWLHPQRGLVPPMEFIPFAEQTGFIRTLTMWVFEEAARHWLALEAEGMPMTLSVNLSTRDLLDIELPQKFDALLVKHRVPAEAYCLEITESAIMDDPQRALGTLNRLSALGFKLSIDDFGTGYSSLAYLKRLPVDELKIDKSFVLSMETDLDDAKIVRSTIDLAHNLGLTVVAEGVENAKAWDLLRELNCDEAQGYHMGRPMPASEFSQWSAVWMARHRPQVAAGAVPMLH
ncbi:MAG: EAL domain-containing protein [Bacteriovorax sp.]|nr:EAL domain-containing protein [Rhizobacter sp.]